MTYQKKFSIITIVAIIFLTLFLYNIVFGLLNSTRGYMFVEYKDLDPVSKLMMDDFYSKNPETISYGKSVDVKFNHYNQFNSAENTFDFVFKGKYKKIINLNVECRIKKGDTYEAFNQDFRDFKPFKKEPNYTYINTIKRPRILRLSFSEIEKYSDGYVEDFSDYDLSKLTLSFVFLGAENETHVIHADPNILYEFNKLETSYNDETKVEEKINNFNKRNKKDIEDLSTYVGNLSLLYGYKPVEGMQKIYELMNVISVSKNKSEILNNVDLTYLFGSTRLYELKEDEIISLMNAFKNVYIGEKKFNKDYQYNLFIILESLNELYKEKTGEYLIPNNFKTLELNEVLEKIH